METDQNDVTTSQGMLRDCQQPLEGKERHGIDSPSESPEGTHPPAPWFLA